eukprot:222822-Amphidinium_carterae.1
MVRDAHDDDGGWNWSGSKEEDFPGSIDLDMLPLTPISELHMHKEPYENPTPYPLADIEPHPTFEGGRSLNGKGLVCCKCTMRYVFSAMAWVRNEYDQRKGMVTTICDWRNPDVEAVLRLQKERDPMMNQIYLEQLKKRWTGPEESTQISTAMTSFASRRQEPRTCLGDTENEPLKYCLPGNPEKPASSFRHMVTKLQNSHKHTVRYLETVKKSSRYQVRVDSSILRIMTSEFGGSADFVTSMGPDDSFVMLC